MLDVALKALGVLGFLIASGSLSWQIWTYRDARRERIGARLSWGATSEFPQISMFVDIWNAGRVPVFVTAVQLAWRDEADRIVKVPFHAQPPVKGALQVGQGHRFYLTPILAPLLVKAAAQPPAKIWVSVTAPRGEILRITGSEVLPCLRQLAPGSNAGQQTNGADPA